MHMIAKIVLGLLLACVASARASAQAQGQLGTPYGYLSTVSNNSTLVLPATSGQLPGVVLRGVLAINPTATLAWLKLYDKVTAPSCGSDTPKWRIPVPASATVPPPVLMPMTSGMVFTTGLGFCVVANAADSDNTNAVANVAINFNVSRR